jgi:hypothetical protein
MLVVRQKGVQSEAYDPDRGISMQIEKFSFGQITVDATARISPVNQR